MQDGQTYIHLDHAATSFPKPPGVAAAMAAFLAERAVNPGRAGTDLGREAAAVVDGRADASTGSSTTPPAIPTAACSPPTPPTR